MGDPDPDLWPRMLQRLASHQALSADDAADVMRAIMTGDVTPAQVGGFLMALRTKGETVDELDGLARTALEFANPVSPPAPVLDTCGTGGDRSGTFNISTLSAIVVAGAGVPVAKHGNRAASGLCGSADLLEELGVAIDLDAAGVERCLVEAGIGFMFAPVFHPAWGHAAPVRRELRVPTSFNFLGPLTNPARPAAQVVGVSDERMLPLMADELTTTGPSLLLDVRSGKVTESRLDPADHGIARASREDLHGGDAGESARIARAVLGGEVGPARDVVLLNAGAALEVAGAASGLDEGIALASSSIDEGKAGATLERWIAVSNSDLSA